MRLAKLVWALLLIFFAAGIGAWAWFLRCDYHQIIQLATEQLQRPDIHDILQNRFFTPQQFQTVRLTAKVCIPLLLLLFVFVFFARKNIWHQLDNLYETVENGMASIRHSLQNSSNSAKNLLGILLAMVMVRSVYYALHFYPQFDECWNYNYFLSNSFFTTLVAYNNYPLHNVITFVFLKILPDSTFAMRLPNIILGILNTVVVFILSKKIFQNEKIGLAGAAIFCVLPTAVFYMMFARGVMLALFFALLILYIIASKPLKQLSKAQVSLLIVISSLGCFAMISFPVFLIVIFLLLLVKNVIDKDKRAVKNLFILLFGTAICTLLLYLPMMLSGVFQLGFSSPHDAAMLDWSMWRHKVEEVSRNQIGFFRASYFFIFINIVFILFSQRKKIAVFNIALLLIPFILPLFIKIYFPARALSFQAVAYVFTFCILLEIILHRTNKFILASGTLIIIILFSYVSGRHTFLTWSAKPDKVAFEIATIFQQKNIKSYYDKSSGFQYFVPGILYHHKLTNRDIQFFTSDTNSTRFLPSSEYLGNCYVEQRITFKPTADKKILYEYSDVDTSQRTAANDFIVYQLFSQP